MKGARRARRNRLNDVGGLGSALGALLLPVAVLAVSCRKAEKSETAAASDVATRYAEALISGDWETAWALVKADDREALPLDSFRNLPEGLETARKEAQARTSVKLIDAVMDGSRVNAQLDTTGPDLSAEPDVNKAPLKTTRSTIVLVKEDAAWRVDTSWAEDKTKLEHEKKVERLIEDAGSLFASGDGHGAKAKLEEALTLAPDNSGAKEALRLVDEDLKSIVAGQWRMQSNVDPMTDDKNVYLRLASETTVEQYGSTHRPTLLARCAERKLDLFIFVGLVVDSDYGEIYDASGRYRFDGDKAQRVRFSLGDSRDTVFFPKAKTWMTSLAAHASSKFVVEIPVFRQGSQVISFDLAGADVAIPEVINTCATGKKPASARTKTERSKAGRRACFRTASGSECFEDLTDCLNAERVAEKTEEVLATCDDTPTNVWTR